MKNHKSFPKYFLFLIFSAMLASCASPKFYFDYDRQADFSKYQTYNYYSEMKTNLSDLDEKRVFSAIDSVLQEKGVVKTKTPDFKINIYASYYKTPSRSRVGIGFGGGGGGVGVGVSGGIPIGGPDLYMDLTIEFVRWPSNVLFWQAVIQSRFYPEMAPRERSEYFQDLIVNALEDYPPE